MIEDGFTANGFTKRRVGVEIDNEVREALNFLPSMPSTPISSKQKSRHRARLLKKAMPEITTDTMKRTLHKLHSIEGDSSSESDSGISKTIPYSSSLYSNSDKNPAKIRSKVALRKPKVLLNKKPSMYTEQCHKRRAFVQTTMLNTAINKVLEAEKEEESATERRLLSEQSAARDATEKMIKRIAVKRVARVLDKAIGIAAIKEVKLRIAEKAQAELAHSRLLVIYRCWRKWRWRRIVGSIRRLGRETLIQKKSVAAAELRAYRLRIAQRSIKENQQFWQYAERQRLKERLMVIESDQGHSNHNAYYKMGYSESTVYSRLIKHELDQMSARNCNVCPSVTLIERIAHSGDEDHQSHKDIDPAVAQEIQELSIAEVDGIPRIGTGGSIYGQDSWMDGDCHEGQVPKCGFSGVVSPSSTCSSSNGVGTETGIKRLQKFELAEMRTNSHHVVSGAATGIRLLGEMGPGSGSANIRFSNVGFVPSPLSTHGKYRHEQIFDQTLGQYSAVGNDVHSNYAPEVHNNSLLASYQRHNHKSVFDQLTPFYSHNDDVRIFELEDRARYSAGLQPFVDQMNEKIRRLVESELTARELSAPESTTAASCVHTPLISENKFPHPKPVTPPAVKKLRRPTSKGRTGLSLGSRSGNRKTVVSVKKKKSIRIKSRSSRLDVDVDGTKAHSDDSRPNTTNMVGLNDGNSALLSSSIPLVMLQNQFGVSAQPTSLAKRMLYEQIYSNTSDIEQVNSLLMTPYGKR